MKWLLRLFVVFVACTALVLVGLWQQLGVFAAGDVLREPATVVIEPGASVRGTVSRLMTEGVVTNDRRWVPYLRLHGRNACVQAGEVELVPPLTPAALLERLCLARPVDRVRVTIPEGLTVWHVADLLDTNGVLDRETFLGVAFSEQSAAQLGIPSTSLEGYLFPDTYELRRDMDADDATQRLVERALDVHTELREAAGPGPYTAAELDWAEVIVLASLVEREAAVAEERPRIARVFINRLLVGMPMQSDPTCTYSETAYNERPTRALCRDAASRYSTYVIPRLPPTPIASPGRAAIEAVLRPSDDAELLYFVSMEDGTGRHAFAATLDEHNTNVRRYLR